MARPLQHEGAMQRKPNNMFHRYLNARLEAERIFAPFFLAFCVAFGLYGFIAPYVNGVPSLFELISDAFAERPVFGILTIFEAKALTVLFLIIHSALGIVLPIALGWIMIRKWRRP